MEKCANVRFRKILQVQLIRSLIVSLLNFTCKIGFDTIENEPLRVIFSCLLIPMSRTTDILKEGPHLQASNHWALVGDALEVLAVDSVNAQVVPPTKLAAGKEGCSTTIVCCDEFDSLPDERD